MEGEDLGPAGQLGDSAGAWKDDDPSSGAASSSPSPSNSPLRATPLGAATNVPSSPGDGGIGTPGDVGAAVYPSTGPADAEAAVGSGTVSAGNVVAGKELSGKKRDGQSTDGGMFPCSAGELSTGEKRRRGRPPGTGRRQLLAVLGEWFAQSAGGNFTPHVVTVPTGEDVASRILSLAQKGPRAICILSANGSISNVTLRQPGSSGGTLTYEGRFEIISLSGSFTTTTIAGIRSRTGGMSVSLAGPDGRMVGGGVAGSLLAASPIQVVVGSFLPNIMKQQQPDKPRPPLTARISPSPWSPTAARPLAQASPELEDVESPSFGFPGSGVDGASPGPSFSPPVVVSWHALQSSAERRASPDMNARLAPGV